MTDDKPEAAANPRQREIMFVRYLYRKGIVTRPQLEEARAIQKKIAALGVEPKSLHRILFEKEYITRDIYDKIRQRMARMGAQVEIRGYRLVEKLGQGSMGTVYMARQLSLDRVVAVKVLAPFLKKNERFVSRFIKEAKVLARLNHPNIVQCIDVGDSGGHYYMAMEYCDGPTVLELLRRGGALAEERAVRIIHHMACALEHAQEHAIIHRDIKPDNIMIMQGGTAKLCDLGLVKDLGSSGGTTDTGSTLGTPNYISPEQASGSEEVDTRSDIYSLGATFYHMVTGRTPFENPNPAVVMVSHIQDMPTPPKQLNPALAQDTSKIILKMLRKNARDRHQDPTALRIDLERLLLKLTGEKIGSGGATVRSRRRRRR